MVIFNGTAVVIIAKAFVKFMLFFALYIFTKIMFNFLNYIFCSYFNIVVNLQIFLFLRSVMWINTISYPQLLKNCIQNYILFWRL